MIWTNYCEITEMSDDFSEPVKRLLAGRAGHSCSNPGCLQSTSGPSDAPKGIMNVGEAAHIAGARPGSARYDPRMTSEQRSSSDNGIWMCSKCAKMIDDDEIRYSVALLHSWRKDAEEHARSKVERGLGRAAAGTVAAPNPMGETKPLVYPQGHNALSGEAIELLLAGAADRQGVVFAVQMLHGYEVSANGREFVVPPSARMEAKWRAVVQELVAAGLIEPRGPKREIHRVTDVGYRLADALEKDRT
jgi:hypothetical protein